MKAPPIETIVHESVAFTVLGPPRPKERARVTARGTFTPRRTREYERAIADQGAWHCGAAWALDGAYRVLVTFVFANHRRRDVDNCLKCVLDGLNGIAWDDDCQVVTATCSKRVGDVERTEVLVERLDLPEVDVRRRRPRRATRRDVERRVRV
jgi:Holliday junction resolvase RusA-like endonuclease